MKVEIKRSITMKPDTPPEKIAEAVKLFERKFVGFEQATKGEIKRAIADLFLKLFPVETRQEFENQIVRLQGLTDSQRFRTEALLVFAEMLSIGLVVAKDEESRRVFEQFFQELEKEIAVSIKEK